MRVLLLLLLLSSPAFAGDPCPLPLQFHEFTPHWRDRAADLGALESKRSWVGVNYRGEEVVTIQRTVPGSPAHAAGLKAGDLIRSFDGVPVTGVKQLNELFDGSSGAVQLGVETAGALRTVALSRGAADPLFLGLVNAAEGRECRSVRVGELGTEQRAAVASGAFTDQRGFRCEDAHRVIGTGFEAGDVVMIRGGRRVLLTMPGWATTCHNVADSDGDKLTSARLLALVEGLEAAYVADRHDNP